MLPACRIPLMSCKELSNRRMASRSILPKHDQNKRSTNLKMTRSKWRQNVLSCYIGPNGSNNQAQNPEQQYTSRVQKKILKAEQPNCNLLQFIQRIPTASTAYSPGIMQSRIDGDGRVDGRMRKMTIVYAAPWNTMDMFSLISVKHATLLRPACNPPSRKGLISGDL